MLDLLDVREHDIWTNKETGDDYVVQSVGEHGETGEDMVALVDFTGDILYFGLESFGNKHDLTHRFFKDF